MRKMISGLCVTGSIMFALVSSSAFAGEGKWVCTKDGKTVKVKGESVEDKKKDCEGQGGSWEKAKGKGDKGGGSKQSSGGGGAW